MAPFTVDYRANFSDTDAAGIVHFSTIFFWVEATEEALFRQLKLLESLGNVPTSGANTTSVSAMTLVHGIGGTGE